MIAQGVIAVELAIGVSGAITSLFPHALTFSARIPMAAAATLLLVYAIYGSFLYLRRPGVPCGCSSVRIPVSVWLPLRSALLTAFAAAAAVAPGEIVGASARHFQLAVVLLASIALATLMWNTVEALYDPDSTSARTTL